MVVQINLALCDPTVFAKMQQDYGKDDMIVCPYNEFHVVRAQRFVRHLMKCRKNNSLADKIACPYNARHIIAKPELEYHLSQCQSKKLMEYNEAKEQANELKSGDLTDPPYHQLYKFPLEESWENDYRQRKVFDEPAPPRRKKLTHRRKKDPMHSMTDGKPRRPHALSEYAMSIISSVHSNYDMASEKASF